MMEARMRGDVDREMLGERIEERQPAERLAERAVQIDQRRPANQPAC